MRGELTTFLLHWSHLGMLIANATALYSFHLAHGSGDGEKLRSWCAPIWPRPFFGVTSRDIVEVEDGLLWQRNGTLFLKSERLLQEESP